MMTGRGRRDELEVFKSAIDLRSFAAHAFGYTLDQRSSTANSALMVGPSGDKVVIARGRDGHHIYFSVSDHTDHGSIVDFCQQRGVGDLGAVRKALRPYLGHGMDRVPASIRFNELLQPIERDIASVRAQWAAMEFLEGGRHRYLNEERGLTPELLANPRFARSIKVDPEHGNAAFAHLDHDGLVGFELKNRAFTGFAKGGRKGAFVSTIDADDEALVLAESAIDLLSYAQMFGIGRRRYMSLAGQVSPEQVELVRRALQKTPKGAHLILAFDNDEAGQELQRRFTALANEERGTELSVVFHPPPAIRECKDWNDALRERLEVSPPPPPPSMG